jgi:hypothetical protein
MLLSGSISIYDQFASDKTMYGFEVHDLRPEPEIHDSRFSPAHQAHGPGLRFTTSHGV